MTALDLSMRRAFLLFLCLASLVSRAPAAAAPLDTKEVSLMLRSGYSSAAVIKELAARHFADEFNDAVEAQLQKAGASPDLVSALRRGAYAAIPVGDSSGAKGPGSSAANAIVP